MHNTPFYWVSIGPEADLKPSGLNGSLALISAYLNSKCSNCKHCNIRNDIVAKEVAYLFGSLRKTCEWHLVARRAFAFHNGGYMLQHNRICV